MSGQAIIMLSEVCDGLNVDVAVVQDFAEFGLYPLVSLEGEAGIEAQYLERLERIISLYQTLGVNKEGIDIILDLREEISSLQARVEELQGDVENLKNRLAQDDPGVLQRAGLLIEISD